MKKPYVIVGTKKDGSKWLWANDRNSGGYPYWKDGLDSFDWEVAYYKDTLNVDVQAIKKEMGQFSGMTKDIVKVEVCQIVLEVIQQIV